MAAEPGFTSRPVIAREIAARVVAAMLADIERDPDDALSAALAAVEQQMLPSPINTLATCPAIDTASEYLQRRVERVRARCGRYLSSAKQHVERDRIAADVTAALTHRYLGYLRS